MRISETIFWHTCEADTQIVQIDSITVEPHVVPTTGNLTLEWSGKTKGQIEGLKVQVQFMRRIIFWSKVLCPEHFNCEMTFCDFLGLDPSCSIAPNTTIYSKKSFDLKNAARNSLFNAGDYSAKFLLFADDGRRVGCTQVFFRIY
ncbi:ganglioside GM2 activator-like [Mobula birostris]|uniref:ganglioside GM2 activator-like n=1 Tax=Mobula birostris TaxID=1983395 RepID=UPI003B286851